MNKLYAIRYTLYATLLLAVLNGCVVRTYPLTKERVDQDLAGGNRGYLKGEVPTGEVRERKTTRTTQTVEVELRSPIRFERLSQAPQEKKAVREAKDEELWGNQGYITQSIPAEITEPKVSGEAGFKSYIVEKNDTLQKISQKFYGTTRKWKKIFEANSDTLKGPDKIYPGQAINIPVEEDQLKETAENLK